MTTEVTLAAELEGEAKHENWRIGYNDAVAGRPNRAASPIYCEGYEAGKQANCTPPWLMMPASAFATGKAR